MNLQVTKGKFDNFSLDDKEFCIDENFNVYEIWVSSETFTADCYMGKMRVIVKNGEVKGWIYPMLPAPSPFERIGIGMLDKWRKITEVYDYSRN